MTTMIILGIETSCDETALSLVEGSGDLSAPKFRLIGSSLFSQAHLHAEFGGVYPNLARREHQKNIIPLFRKLLADAGWEKKSDSAKASFDEAAAAKTLDRETELLPEFVAYISSIEKPAIDAIAVTTGPGLEPALWVGINFARALGVAWNIPVIATNHMEGHIVSPLLSAEKPVEFPALALLISGGHTELVEMKSWREFRILGATRDDAVGEAFDKVARILSLPYPGGPEISKLAAQKRAKSKSGKGDGEENEFKLPRPMINTPDFEFSFAGLKTSVLYAAQNAQKIAPLTPDQKESMACEFENAVTEVLIAKTRRALDAGEYHALILGGGVVANVFIRKAFADLAAEYSDLDLLIPDKNLSTDNAVMIAMAGYIDTLTGTAHDNLKATGNLKF